MIKRLLPFLPLVVIAAIGIFLYFGLSKDPSRLSSALVTKPVPAFSLPLLDAEGSLTQKDVTKDQLTLVNFFASWCPPCRAEHETLMQLANDQGFRLVGVSYKDDPKASKAFLDELGDPFEIVAFDQPGRTAIDWGVAGVPETFVVAADGTIHGRVAQPLISDTAIAELNSAIESAKQ